MPQVLGGFFLSFLSLSFFLPSSFPFFLVLAETRFQIEHMKTGGAGLWLGNYGNPILQEIVNQRSSTSAKLYYKDSEVSRGRQAQTTLASSLKHTHACFWLSWLPRWKTRLLENPEMWPDMIRPQNPTLQTYRITKVPFPLFVLWAFDSFALAAFRFRVKQWEFIQ